MTKHRANSVIIPKSPLADNLAEAGRIKHEMTALLRELEQQVAPKNTPDQPGGWRHDPTGWARRHKI